jgi:hypothetical protein
MKNTAFWDVMLRLNFSISEELAVFLLVCFMLYIFLTLKMEAVSSSETPLSCAELHSVTYQVIVLFKISSVRFRKKIIKILLFFQNINI